MLAGLAGTLQAGVLLLVVVHGVMGWPSQTAGGSSALSRTDSSRESSGPSWREQLEASHSGRLAVGAGRALDGPLSLPTWVEEWMARARESLRGTK